MFIQIVKGSEASKVARAHLNSPKMLEHQRIARLRVIERLNKLGIKHNIKP